MFYMFGLDISTLHSNLPNPNNQKKICHIFIWIGAVDDLIRLRVILIDDRDDHIKRWMHMVNFPLVPTTFRTGVIYIYIVTEHV